MNFRTEFDWSHVIDPITDEEVVEWIAALRSGKYKQANHKLHDFNGHCCLGVEVEIHPNAAIKALFLLSDKDNKIDALWFRLPADLQKKLASKNDGERKGFHFIADFIEKGFYPDG